MKRYISWFRVKVNNHRYIDPNTDNMFNNVTTGAKFTETPYKNINNGKFVSFIEYPDNTTQERIDELMSAYGAFRFRFITEAKANSIISNYGDDENGNQLVTVKDFVFTDNRPNDI